MLLLWDASSKLLVLSKRVNLFIIINRTNRISRHCNSLQQLQITRVYPLKFIHSWLNIEWFMYSWWNKIFSLLMLVCSVFNSCCYDKFILLGLRSSGNWQHLTLLNASKSSYDSFVLFCLWFPLTNISIPFGFVKISCH